VALVEDLRRLFAAQNVYRDRDVLGGDVWGASSRRSGAPVPIAGRRRP
jgi:hypothetical protein